MNLNEWIYGWEPKDAGSWAGEGEVLLSIIFFPLIAASPARDILQSTWTACKEGAFGGSSISEKGGTKPTLARSALLV